MVKKVKRTKNGQVVNNIKLGMAIYETILAIPLLGGLIIISFAWTPLAIALAGHIVALVFSVEYNKKKTGPIIGIVASVLGIIPFVGMILHILAAIFNYREAFTDK